jgi:DnaJ-class molecular chaperone
MGLFHYLSDWKNNLYEKRVAQAESMGNCPECNGKGFQMPILNEYYFSDVFDCSGCNGTGTYTQWYEINRKESR